MNEPKFEYLGELRAELDPAQQLGPTPHGVRMILPAKQGRFEGPKIQADILASGGDWFLIRNDGTGELDVRLSLKTEDDQLIYVTYQGILLFTPEIIERWGRGEVIAPNETYFRITPYFETASEKYSWLNWMVVVGLGQLVPGGVCYQLFQVK